MTEDPQKPDAPSAADAARIARNRELMRAQTAQLWRMSQTAIGILLLIAIAALLFAFL